MFLCPLKLQVLYDIIIKLVPFMPLPLVIAEEWLTHLHSIPVGQCHLAYQGGEMEEPPESFLLISDALILFVYQRGIW